MKRIASLLLAVIMVLGVGIYVPTETLAADESCYLKLQHGAAVRLAEKDTTGLRWTAFIDESLYTNYDDILEKGFIIAPTAYVTGGRAILNGKYVKAKSVASDLTEEALEAAGLDFIKVQVEGFLDADETEFSAYITNLYEDNFSLDYSARAYLDVKDSNGISKRIYSSFEEEGGDVDYYAVQDNSRSPGDVAKKALDDLSDQRIGKYFFNVAGTGKFSPYSATQREILSGFILEDPVKPTEDFTYPTYDNADEYKGMRDTLKDWIKKQLDENGDGKIDGSFFYVELQEVSTLHGYNMGDKTVSFDTLKSRWSAGLEGSFDDESFKVIYTDNTSGLKFTTTVTLYGDVPTADIKTIVENMSTSTSMRSHVIKNFYAINSSFNLAEANGNITLKTLKGSDASDDDFDLVVRNLTDEFVQPEFDNQWKITNENTVFYPEDSSHKAFSSSGEGFPYFNLIGENKGLMMAIGWSGKWEAGFKKDSAGNAVFQAKQQTLSTYLSGGDSIEAPRIVLTYFVGDEEYGHNVWREMMLSHYTPDDDNDESNGNNLKAPISANFGGGTYYETINNSVSNLVNAGAPIDIVWMDAGWYGNLLYKNDADTSKVPTVYRSSADVFNTETEADQQRWEAFLTNPQSNLGERFNNEKSAHPNWNAVLVQKTNAVWAEFMGNYVENSFLFPGERGIGLIGDHIDELNGTEGYEDLKFMLWWMIFDRSKTHSNYYYQEGDLAVEAGANKLQLLTEQDFALAEAYNATHEGDDKLKYIQHLANLEDSDHLATTTTAAGANYSVSNPYYGGRVDISKDTVLNKLIAYFEYMMKVKGVDAVRLDNSHITAYTFMYTDTVTRYKETGATTYVDGSVYPYKPNSTIYRLGYTENKWTTNEYKLWDTLKEINPNFFLDNTASGGRRLDIELVSRGVALWRTDLNDSRSSATDTFYEQHQEQTQNISLWIPLTSAGYNIDVGSEPTVYQARSLYSASGSISATNAYNTEATYSHLKDENGAKIKKIDHAVNMANEFAALRPYWYGNYYQLLDVANEGDGSVEAVDAYRTWQSYQLYREDLNEGMFVVIRREEISVGESVTIKLKGLRNCASYKIVDIDGVVSEQTYTGEHLMNEGLSITVPDNDTYTSPITQTSKDRGISTYKIILVD